MIDWAKYGFKPDAEYENCYLFEDTNAFPFEVHEHDGFLSLIVNDEYTISKGKIPATNQSVTLLLKAFAVQRAKS